MKALSNRSISISGLIVVKGCKPGLEEGLVKVEFVGFCGGNLNACPGANPLAERVTTFDARVAF